MQASIGNYCSSHDATYLGVPFTDPGLLWLLIYILCYPASLRQCRGDFHLTLSVVTGLVPPQAALSRFRSRLQFLFFLCSGQRRATTNRPPQHPISKTYHFSICATTSLLNNSLPIPISSSTQARSYIVHLRASSIGYCTLNIHSSGSQKWLVVKESPLEARRAQKRLLERVRSLTAQRLACR